MPGWKYKRNCRGEALSSARRAFETRHPIERLDNATPLFDDTDLPSRNFQRVDTLAALVLKAQGAKGQPMSMLWLPSPRARHFHAQAEMRLRKRARRLAEPELDCNAIIAL